MQTWVDGRKDAEYVGMSAGFGRIIESEHKTALRTPLIHSVPKECCKTPKIQVITY